MFFLQIAQISHGPNIYSNVSNLCAHICVNPSFKMCIKKRVQLFWHAWVKSDLSGYNYNKNIMRDVEYYKQF